MNWETKRAEQGLDAAEAISTSGPGAGNQVAGMPLAEYNRASLQACLRCQRDPKDTIGGILLNMRVVEQVLVADTLCRDCMTPAERAKYEEVQSDGPHQ